jgi:hypothetical protein
MLSDGMLGAKWDNLWFDSRKLLRDVCVLENCGAGAGAKLFWGVGCSCVPDVGNSEMTMFFGGWGGAGASEVIIWHE